MIEIYYLVIPMKYYFYKPQLEKQVEDEPKWFKTRLEAEEFVSMQPKIDGLVYSIRPIRYLPLKEETEKP